MYSTSRIIGGLALVGLVCSSAVGVGTDTLKVDGVGIYPSSGIHTS